MHAWQILRMTYRIFREFECGAVAPRFRLGWSLRSESAVEYDERIQDYLRKAVRGSVEEALNAMLDAEAERLCNAGRYERTEARRDTRAAAITATCRCRRAKCVALGESAVRGDAARDQRGMRAS